jgi:hypothetical protein
VVSRRKENRHHLFLDTTYSSPGLRSGVEEKDGQWYFMGEGGWIS